MKSKTKINRQSERKRNPELVKTIKDAQKSRGWFKISEILASPRRNHKDINLNQIEEQTKEGETIVVPGKVLSMGEINKKIKIVAFNFSDGAREKILKSGGKISTISEEIKINPDAKGVRILG
ncbi:MAG: 50S ribosomal protein L18e [Nanoarchaeota archaeon]|nr:50S ribosomal protein L18e [Nanoarchaeota archaeon]